jgi:hypothetical protein
MPNQRGSKASQCNKTNPENKVQYETFHEELERYVKISLYPRISSKN